MMKDFNFDFHVSFTEDEMAQGKVIDNYTMQKFPSAEAPGISVYFQERRRRRFSHLFDLRAWRRATRRTYMILDMLPKGRDEDELGFTMQWVCHHDRYGIGEFAVTNKPYSPQAASPSSTTCLCGSAEAHS